MPDIRSETEHHGYCCMNPILASQLFVEAIIDLENDLENFVITDFYDTAKKYVEHVVGPRRTDETPDAYRVRVFADMINKSERNDDRDHDRGNSCDHLMYAREATESGESETARRWYLRLIVDTDAADPNYWLLYATFCVRHRDWDMAMECTRRAIALDIQHRLALFVRAAILMACFDMERLDETEASLEYLSSAYPRFSEAHLLSALHFRRMNMLDRSTEYATLSKRFVNDVTDDSTVQSIDHGGQCTAVWEPVAHGGDCAVKCAVLLIKLEVVTLASDCLRAFGDRVKGGDRYHYLMAVTHHKRGEFDASGHHLTAMSCDAKQGWWPQLLEGHNDYGAGRFAEALCVYKTLSSQRSRVQSSLVYSRMADMLAARGYYTEAVNAYRRACAMTGTPALKVKLAACLLFLKKNDEAETYLSEAVAMDGADNGVAWHYLAVVYARSGNEAMADVCRQQATDLGFVTGDLRIELRLFE